MNIPPAATVHESQTPPETPTHVFNSAPVTSPAPQTHTPPVATPVVEDERRYVVLEKHDLPTLIVDAIKEFADDEDEQPMTVPDLVIRLSRHFADVIVYEPLGTRVSRNATQAYSRVVKERFGDAPGSMDLVAVSEKMWKPKRATSNVRSSVSVG